MHVGVVVEVVVQLLGAGGEGEDLTALVQVSCVAPVILPALAMSTKASTYISVWTPRSFRSDWAIMAADGVGHAADAQLQAGAVGDLRHDQVCDLQVHLGRRRRQRPAGRWGGLSPLHDAGPPRRYGHSFPYRRGSGAYSSLTSTMIILAFSQTAPDGKRWQAEVEVAVLVHRSHLEDGDVQRVEDCSR